MSAQQYLPGVISFIINWQKVDLVSVSCSKALIRENKKLHGTFETTSVSSRGMNLHRDRCIILGMSTEPKYSENRSAEIYG